MNIFLLGIKILSVRIIDVTLGTIRTIYTVKNKNFIASTIGFFEVLVWFIIAKEALDTTNNSIFIGVFYALGFSFGTFIGGLVSNRVIKGNITVEVITSNATNKWLEELRSNGFAVSVMDLKEKENTPDKFMLYIEINKNDFNRLYKIIKKYDKNAFVVASESKFAINGYFKK